MIVVHRFVDELEAQILVDTLQNQGIEATIRSRRDAVWDGLPLNMAAAGEILVADEHVGKARAIVAEYLESLPKSGDSDPETLRWKAEIARKTLRYDQITLWIAMPATVAFCVWLMVGGRVERVVCGVIILALACLVFWLDRLNRRKYLRAIEEAAKLDEANDRMDKSATDKLQTGSSHGSKK
jgi:hypothetical protein